MSEYPEVIGLLVTVYVIGILIRAIHIDSDEGKIDTLAVGMVWPITFVIKLVVGMILEIWTTVRHPKP